MHLDVYHSFTKHILLLIIFSINTRHSLEVFSSHNKVTLHYHLMKESKSWAIEWLLRLGSTSWAASWTNTGPTSWVHTKKKKKNSRWIKHYNKTNGEIWPLVDKYYRWSSPDAFNNNLKFWVSLSSSITNIPNSL